MLFYLLLNLLFELSSILGNFTKMLSVQTSKLLVYSVQF